MQELEPLQITTILWSFGKLNYNPGVELMEVLLAAISLNIGQFATQVPPTFWTVDGLHVCALPFPHDVVSRQLPCESCQSFQVLCREFELEAACSPSACAHYPPLASHLH